MAKFANALDKLGQLLEPEHQRIVAQTRDLVLANATVVKEGISFGIFTLREFFSAFHTGMAYAAVKYQGSIPRNIMFYANLASGGVPTEWMRVAATSDGAVDEIQISHICIARYCQSIEHGELSRACDHLPEGYAASARTCAICHAIEECYHYYDAMVLKRPDCVSLGNRNHPLEIAVFPIIETAIADLHLPVYKISELSR